MKILKDETATTARKRRIVVELDPGEQLIAIDPDTHYQLTDPHDDIIPGHVFLGMRPAVWCSLEQKWRT